MSQMKAHLDQLQAEGQEITAWTYDPELHFDHYKEWIDGYRDRPGTDALPASWADLKMAGWARLHDGSWGIAHLLPEGTKPKHSLIGQVDTYFVKSKNGTNDQLVRAKTFQVMPRDGIIFARHLETLPDRAKCPTCPALSRLPPLKILTSRLLKAERGGASERKGNLAGQAGQRDKALKECGCVNCWTTGSVRPKRSTGAVSSKTRYMRPL